MRDAQLHWPKKGDRAFPAAISASGRAQPLAFVMPTESAYIAGYQRAADMIVEAAHDDDLNPDDLVFPVVYLYRHHLELMLKGLVRLGVRLGSLDDCENNLGGHNLHKLWNKAKQLIKEVWPDSPDDDVQAVEQVILQFHKLDPTGQAFRYARDTKGTPHLQNAPARVELVNLKATLDSVSTFLDAAYAGIDSCDPG